MGFIKKFWGKQEKDTDEHITDLSQKIGVIIDKTVNEIFSQYHALLLKEDITYIVFAVWGAKKYGVLTPEQKEINNKIIPIVNEVIQLLKNNSMNAKQIYALGFLVRALIISKTTFLIESLRVKIEHKLKNTDGKTDISNIFPPSFQNDTDHQADPTISHWLKRFGNEGNKRW